MRQGKVLFPTAGLLLSALLFFSLYPLSRPIASNPILGGLRPQNLDLPYDAGGSSMEEEDPPEILVFYGQSYEATAVVFALDASGSMRDQQRWELQTREVSRAISELGKEAEFGVVYYASGVTPFRNQPLPAIQGNKAAGLAFVQSRYPAGDTCVGEGVVKALEIVRRSRSEYRAVIVTSDGRPDNCATGDRATPQQIQMIFQKTLAANPGRQVKIHTIYVGSNSDRQAMDFMRRLAELHGGTFRAVTR